jgi:hypothetical protein
MASALVLPAGRLLSVVSAQSRYFVLSHSPEQAEYEQQKYSLRAVAEQKLAMSGDPRLGVYEVVSKIRRVR